MEAGAGGGESCGRPVAACVTVAWWRRVWWEAGGGALKAGAEAIRWWELGGGWDFTQLVSVRLGV